MRPEFNLLSTFSILLALSAFQNSFAGMVGTDVDKSSEPATCRVLYRDHQDHHLISVCSGTLTAPDTVSTAGHCNEGKENNLKVIVECGYQGNTGSAQEEITQLGGHILTAGPQFLETRIGQTLTVADTYAKLGFPDLGEIKLDHPILNINPVQKRQTLNGLLPFFSIVAKWVNHKAEIVLSIQPEAQCKFEGFGINGEGKGGDLLNGTLDASASITFDAQKKEIAAIQQLNLSQLKNQDEQQEFINVLIAVKKAMNPVTITPLAELIQKKNMIKSQLMPGDSGGPLYCRQNQNQPWNLVGVASTIGFLINWKEINLNSANSKIFMSSTWIIFDDALQVFTEATQ